MNQSHQVRKHTTVCPQPEQLRNGTPLLQLEELQDARRYQKVYLLLQRAVYGPKTARGSHRWRWWWLSWRLKHHSRTVQTPSCDSWVLVRSVCRHRVWQTFPCWAGKRSTKFILLVNRLGKDNEGQDCVCVYKTAWERCSRARWGCKSHSVGFWLSAHPHAAHALPLSCFQAFTWVDVQAHGGFSHRELPQGQGAEKKSKRVLMLIFSQHKAFFLPLGMFTFPLYQQRLWHENLPW